MADIYEALRPTPERDAQNSIRFWFGKVKDCGMPVPRTVILDTWPELVRAFYMERPAHDLEVVNRFVEGQVRPAMKANGIGLPFLKNGGFSNKFDAGHACLPYADDIANAVIHIMQGAMECCGFQYDGTDCLAVRERIGHDRRETPCIYGGLPFRTEFRVFYDFDRKQPVFTANYWDWDEVYPKLYDMTDKLVFEGHYGKIKTGYDRWKDTVQDIVASAMSRVEGLSGPWSVDVLLDGRQGPEKPKFWLIDMAVAEMSAYWDRRPGRGQ